MSSILGKIKLWMQQGTSILGASGALAVITAWSLNQMNDKQAIAALVGCLVSFALPQTSTAKVDATALSAAVINRFLVGPTNTPPGTPVAVEAKTF